MKKNKISLGKIITIALILILSWWLTYYVFPSISSGWSWNFLWWLIGLLIGCLVIYSIYLFIKKWKKKKGGSEGHHPPSQDPHASHADPHHGGGELKAGKITGFFQGIALVLVVILLICLHGEMVKGYRWMTNSFSYELKVNEWTEKVEIPVGKKITELSDSGHRFWIQMPYGAPVLVGPGRPFYSNLTTADLSWVRFKADTEPFELEGKLVDM
jgi:amino acid transporter